MLDIKAISKPLEAKMIEYRRHFHANPELAFNENNTKAFIVKKLNELGIKMMDGISGNSVVGYIETGLAGPCIAFRADIDALPLQEFNQDKPYCSKVDNVMHACGHDAHTAILLGLCEAFATQKQILKGKVVFLFQQAEEKLPGGAKPLVEDGALEGVDMVFGLHVSPARPVGSIGASAGRQFAASDSVLFTIQGKGGHGAAPHAAIDPISAGASLVQELQYVLSKFKDPMLPLVVNPCAFNAGDAFNVIPDSCEVKCTVRSFDAPLREAVAKKIQDIAAGVAATTGTEIVVDYTFGYPAVITNEEQTDMVKRAAEKLDYECAPNKSEMGSEDFAYYLAKKPGAFFMLGVAIDGQQMFPPHHPKFDLDERALIVGLECMLGTYAEAVNA